MAEPLFRSAAWQALFKQGFDAELVFGQWTYMIFDWGPFRIAYPDFPVGGRGQPSREDVRLLRENGVDVVRLSGEARIENLKHLPVTIITDLKHWNSNRLPAQVKRKLRKSRRMSLKIVPCSNDDGAVLYELYRKTLEAKKGTERYTQRYFRALAELSEKDERLIVLLAKVEDTAIGFIAGAIEGENAIYLHGGTDRNYAAYRSGYTLMEELLLQLKEKGAQTCNLLASPADQPSLVNYKESWGGTTHKQAHWDEPLSQKGRLLSWALRARDILRE